MFTGARAEGIFRSFILYMALGKVRAVSIRAGRGPLY